MKAQILATICLFLMTTFPLLAQNPVDDFFRSTGKIYTVLAVMVILFVVFIVFLVRLEGKIRRLEKQIKK